MLKNAHLLRFPHFSPFYVQESTPHGSGFRRPCIGHFWTVCWCRPSISRI